MATRGKHSAPRRRTAPHGAPRSASHGARRPAAHGGAHSAQHSAAHGTPKPHTPHARHAAGAHSAHGAGAHYRTAPRGHARSRRRKRRRAVAGLVALAAVVVIIAAVVHALNAPVAVAPAPPDQPEQASQSSQAVSDPDAEYARIVGLVNQADRTVVPLSRVISKKVDDRVVKRIDKVLAGQDSAAKLLDEASLSLQNITPQLEGGDRQKAASTLADAIAAREDMLAYGCVVLKASAGAYRATDRVVETWQNFIEGHQDLQKAADSVTSGTTADVKKSLRLDSRALKHFERASRLVEKIQETAPNADLSIERDYADLQTKAAQAAVKCDRALLDEDAKAAKKHNAAYAKRAAAAAKVAKTLPATTDVLVKSIYYSFGTADVSVEDAQDRYEAAAKRAAKDGRKLARLDGSETSKKD